MKKLTVEPTKPQYKVFDWIVDLPIIRLLKPIYEWKRSFWIYCVIGFVSTASNYVLSLFLDSILPSATLANVIAWIVTTLLAFVMFRYMYFDRTNNSFINELMKFTSGRIFTFLFETLVVFIFVDKLGMKMWLIKIILIPATAILNYFISKIFVFKNK